MKDFFKIFFVLCGFVGSFLYGRNYGEQAFKQSEEYLMLTKAKEDYKPLNSLSEDSKANIQNQVLSNERNLGPESISETKTEKNLSGKPTETLHKAQIAIEPEAESVKLFDHKKLKSYEWILLNAQSAEDVAGNLKNLEIKNMDSYMAAATGTRPQDEAQLFGSYRGRILDVTNKEYGTFSLEIAPWNEEGKDQFKGSLKLFRNGRQERTDNFSGTNFGYRFENSSGIVINFGSNYYQLYKIPQTQQIAGFFYERLVNGTTKTIGSFVLNRVDQF